MKYNKYRARLIKTTAILIILTILITMFTSTIFASEDSSNNSKEKLDWNIEGYPNSENKNKWFAEDVFYHKVRRNLYYDEDIYYDSENKRKKERQFLRATFFVDDDVELELLSLDNLMSGITVYSDSGSISMLDVDFINDELHKIQAEYSDSENIQDEKIKEFIDKYIFIKDSNNRATLYIPVKPLMPNMTYNVQINANIVVDNKSYDGNDSYTWDFKTMPVPSASEEGVIIQSVIEDYDVTKPLIIYGKDFVQSNTEVFFNDTRAYRTRVRQYRGDAKYGEDREAKENEEKSEVDQYLEIYLPRGRNKLKPGLYNIIIENSRNHSVEIYGALSIIPESNKKIPVEEDKYSTKTPYGFVRGSSIIELVRLDYKDPVKEEILKRQLANYTLKSPIVETVGRRYYVYTLEIPVEQGVYKNYRVLKYDESRRTWVEEDCYINDVDQRAIVTNTNLGIFVVVEPKY